MHIFWDVLEFMANTVVFFYFGIVIAARIWDGHKSSSEGEEDAAGNLTEDGVSDTLLPPGEKLLEGKDYGYAILSWVFLNIIRLVVISVLQPLLNHHGDGFSWRDVLLSTWSGLRGAVGLALALIVDLESIELRPEQTAQERLDAARCGHADNARVTCLAGRRCAAPHGMHAGTRPSSSSSRAPCRCSPSSCRAPPCPSC